MTELDRSLIRRTLHVTGAPLRVVLITLVRVYRATLSGFLGGQCRFHPSCSAYAEQAIRERGAIRGFGLAVWRVLRCNPFGRGGVEPVPSPPSVSYDAVTHRRAS